MRTSALAATVAFASVLPLDAQDLAPRRPVPKAAVVAIPVSPALSEDWAPAYRLLVKFVDAARVRAGQDGALVSQAGVEIEQARQLAAQFGVRFAPAIHTPEGKLDALLARAAERTGAAQPDLAGILAVVGAGAGPEEMVAIGEAFQALDVVEFASISTLAVPPPGDIAPPTPDHVPDQNYRGPDPGMDADYALSQGATGAGVKISDCEYGWVTSHEDLNDLNTNPEPGQTIHPSVISFGWDDHGTAVLGETSAVVNGYGCSGMTPDAGVFTYTEWSVEQGLRRLTSITNAIADSGVGDVVLLEMQNGAGAPAEVDAAIWTVVKAGSDAGVVVVGAAGNGDQDLDSGAYSAYQALGDSGAIIVGAGSPDTDHDKLFFSSYGSRVDVQGWGLSVFSLGYGDAAIYGGDPNQSYTFFSGTSSASPFVASACAALQDLALDHLGGPLSPAELRTVLIDSGIPQGSGGQIGPFIDMRAAINALGIAFSDLGNGLAGTGAIEPTLTAEGVFEVGRPVSFTVADAAPFAPLALVVGSSQVDLAVGGGTLVPAPELFFFGAATGQGEFVLADDTPANLSPGAILYFQAWIVDAGGPFGFSATNAVVGTVH